jgi:sugar phosphate isomerase/epimerase
MATPLHRRDFLKTVSLAALGAGLASAHSGQAKPAPKAPLFRISLAEWSLHRSLFDRKLENLDFPRVAREQFGIDAVEYVNQFFKDKAKDRRYLSELKQQSEDAGVQNLLIMVDGEGALGDADEARRKQAVENHYKWVEAARYLGCHSIRVNAESSGTYQEQLERAADGLKQLTVFGGHHGVNVIVENHGGLSSHGGWLASVIRKVGLPRCGTLPDFGNFNLGKGEYDRYRGVMEMMPFAKAVSAKSHDFEPHGYEVHTDYFRMMRIVLDSGYRGSVGIEYEGNKLSEPEGIKATKRLLEKVHDAFTYASSRGAG